MLVTVNLVNYPRSWSRSWILETLLLPKPSFLTASIYLYTYTEVYAALTLLKEAFF